MFSSVFGFVLNLVGATKQSFRHIRKKKKRRGKKTALIDSFTDYIPINDEVISTTEGGGTSTDGCDQ